MNETLSPAIPGLVTIVVPAYRAERFLPGALESVRCQKYGNWELVVVEDASEGETQRLVEAFAEAMPQRRIVYRRHAENGGPSATRNTALALARGEFVAFLDADDLWLPTHVAAAVEALDRGAADVAYASAVMFEDQSERLLGVWGPTSQELADFPRSLVRRSFITPSATVMRRRVLELVGPFDPPLRTCEDLDYWFRALEAGVRFVHVPGCHCLYRKGVSGSGSDNVRRIVESQTRILERHRGKAGIPLRDWDRALTYYRTAAGALNWEEDARRAAPYFWVAWRGRRWRVDLLLVALLCKTVFPLLPNLGIVRRINRAIRSR